LSRYIFASKNTRQPVVIDDTALDCCLSSFLQAKILDNQWLMDDTVPRVIANFKITLLHINHIAIVSRGSEGLPHSGNFKISLKPDCPEGFILVSFNTV
jgi:hypothetical protein